MGGIDLAHAAGPEQPAELIGTELTAGETAMRFIHGSRRPLQRIEAAAGRFSAGVIEQRLDFLTQRLVSRAGGSDEAGAIAHLALESRVIEL